MATEHKAITDPNNHEPKNISTANADTVYVANGAGTGTWKFPSWNNLNNQQVILNVRMDDISSAGSVWVVSPFGGDIKKIWSVIDGPITGADAVITSKIGGVSVTDGALTIAQSGSAAGDVDVAVPTALNGISEGQPLELESNGGSTGTVPANFTILLEIT